MILSLFDSLDSYILDKLIKGIDFKINKTNKNKEKDKENKEKTLKEKIESNFFLKKGQALNYM